MPPASKTTQTGGPTATARKRPSKPKRDPEAPHGREADGTPKAPYGLLETGKPRLYPKREVADLDVAMLAAPMDVSESVAEVVRPARPRNAQQQAVDAVVSGIYDKWEAAGKPKDWKDLPKGRYNVPPDKVDDIKFLINKAGTFLGVRVRFGQTMRTQEGLSVVVFAVLARSPKRVKKTAP